MVPNGPKTAWEAMGKEELEVFYEGQLNEQREIMADFDADKIERDPLVDSGLDVSLAWKDVSFSIQVPDPADPRGRNKIDRVLLEKCNGHVEAGSLVAIMGPSGCGKSTLLDILAQKKTSKYDGDVYLNGHNIRGDNLLRRVAAYVGQEDTMPEYWTTREAIEFNTRLKKAMPRDVTAEMIRKGTDQMLTDLGLKHVADTKIGGPNVRGLSGGQRRRVTLARGLASQPRLLFCDEPTSGLSATDAELCIKILKVLSKKWGTTVLVVIHQPRVEVAKLFTHLVLLTSQPGRVVYNGPMSEAAAYCGAVGLPVPAGHNYADHLLDVVTPGAPGADPARFRAHYVKHTQPGVQASVDAALQAPGNDVLAVLEKEREMNLKFCSVPPVRRSKYGVSFLTQVKILLRRKIKLSLIDPSVVGLVVVQAFLGLAMGLIYFGVGEKEPRGFTQLGYLFVFINMVTLAPVMSMPSQITDRVIMKTEVSESLYSEFAHVIAFLTVTVSLSLLGMTLLCVLMFAMGKMPWGSFGNLFYWGLLNFLMMDAMVGLGCAVSKSVETANYVLMPFQIFAGMFNGFALTKISAPSFLKWIFYISPASYAVEDISHFNYGSEPAVWDALVRTNGFEWTETSFATGTAITLAITLLGRIGQVFALKYCQNIKK